MWTIIPDLHADMDRLECSLSRATGTRCAFLGDFIDAGPDLTAPEDEAVLQKVRGMVEAGEATAIMGNHELNAILYHRQDENGLPLREHSRKNADQHASFLRRFQAASPEALDWTSWFLTLPLWHDLGGARLVHACWSQPHIDLIAERRPDGLLCEEDLPEIAAEATEFGRAVKLLVSGPEVTLPAGSSFRDGRGHCRSEVRLAWWRSGARTYREAALSVPDPADLPDVALSAEQQSVIYPAEEVPVFVGHYKMAGKPGLEAPNAACLDYPSSPCLYHWKGEGRLLPEHLQTV